MTCKDCKYYGKEVNINDKTYHLCTDSGDLMTADEEEEMCSMCGQFVSKDGTYYNGTEHCPRCGRVVGKWGLCMDCEILYGSCKQEVFSVL